MTPTIPPERAGKLEQEVRTWLAHRDALVRQSPGKFVVIKGEQIFGIFDDQADAYAQAYRQFGNVPFLLRPIQREEEVYYIGGSAYEGAFLEEENAAPEPHRS